MRDQQLSSLKERSHLNLIYGPMLPIGCLYQNPLKNEKMEKIKPKHFNEESLITEIGQTWGLNGAHMDVFNEILKERNMHRESIEKVAHILERIHIA